MSAVLTAQEPSAKYLVHLPPPLVRHFDLIAQAPGGVARLRELILTLAVQGKLVPQDPGDEPASELLKKIRSEKDRLIAEGKIKRDKPLAEIADEEKLFGLSQGWKFCRLGDLLLSIRSGGTPSKQNPDFWNGDIPWASVKDLSFGDPIKDTQDRITRAGLEAGSELAPSGAILICTRMGLGKIGEARIDVAINQDLKAVILGDGVDKQYFINYFKTLSVVGSGMTVAGIKQDELLSFVVPLPPQAEQSRIVTRVEELMQLCDALEASGKLEAQQHAQLVTTLLGTLTQSETPEALADNWQRIATHFDMLLDRPKAVDAFEQTILQLGVRGLLVPQDPTDEPASVLLQKIRTEKDQLIAQGKIKRDKPLPPITDEEKPFELPRGWEWVLLCDLMPDFQNGASSRGDSGGQLITVLRLADIKKRRISLTNTRQIPIASNDIAKYRLEAGDILITRVNGSAEIVGQFNLCDRPVDAIYCDHFIRMRIDRQWIAPDFCALLGESPIVRESIQSLFITTAGQKTVNQGHIGSLQFPLPPLSEQSRIVTRVNELRSLCADLRARLESVQFAQTQLTTTLMVS